MRRVVCCHIANWHRILLAFDIPLPLPTVYEQLNADKELMTKVVGGWEIEG
jgi:hypothetical protein